MLQRSEGRRRAATPVAGLATDAYAAKVVEVVERLRAVRVLPVLTVDDVPQAEATCVALVAGGLPCVEVAFRTPAAPEALRRLRGIGGVLLGAGTVLSVEEAYAAADAGADFAVAPGLSEDVVAACRKLGLPFFPGVATPSEIAAALRLGLRTLKVFPAEQLGGAAFVRAVASAYPECRFLPTGGVSPENLLTYLAEPSVVACGGSWMVKRELLQGGRFDEVERLARRATELAR
jgi:2-dehydro-3-deoxyphosphogluconate aldolase / (4S)-4-hydroxy-2-oxoglutarate aldolase